MATATRFWDIEFDRDQDDLGTSLAPSEIQIHDNEVEFLGGRGKTRQIRLKNPVHELHPKDIKVARHFAAFGDSTGWEAVSTTPA